MSEQQQQPTLITDEIFYKLTAAHSRLTQLMNTKVPDDQAGAIAHHEEFKLLTEQISAVFLAHAPEFLGAVYVLKNEYTPLVRAMVPLVHNAVRVAQASAPISEAAQTEVMNKSANEA